jgi:leucyl aminopeptidase
MDFSIKIFDAKTTIHSIKTGCIVVGVFENKKLSEYAQQLDVNHEITAALKSGDVSGKPGSSMMLRHLSGVTSERVLLVGLGKDESITEKDFSTALKSVIRILASLGTSDAVLALPMEAVKERDVAWLVQAAVLAVHDHAYRSDSLKSKKDPEHTGVKKITLVLPAYANEAGKAALNAAQAIAQGMTFARDLGNAPANICTPTYLAESAKKLAKQYKLGLEILDRKQLEALKMGSFLSVTNGSVEPPKFIVLKHMGGKAKDAPIVLVGKGITFDTGGISIKPSASMDEMKYDMCGAASVLGTLQAVAEMKLKLNVIGVIPTCENMPSGSATRPGDVVTSMSGQTIEILNTDAEGRLILCDALTYVERFKPSIVVDIATLTGACVVALGNHHSGLFSRDDAAHEQLVNDLVAAGKSSGDTVWRMPIGEAYNEQLKSNFADMANIGTPGGGSCTAACFLERFTRNYTWAHLDIAGTAWKGGAAKGATGRPVPLLTTFLMHQAER